ncbi:MAG: lamin tail domain-containing protein, partial [Planctomycetes bacterium]|nr:lamin tail domain-containing protein [Planctomycetota bacterium]
FADWTERYKWHLRSVIDQTFNPTHLVPLAQQWHAMIYNDVVADTKKVYSTAHFQQNLTATITSSAAGGGTISGLIPFINARYSYLNTHAYLTATRVALSDLAHSPALPSQTQPIGFTVQATGAASVDLWWRRVGAFQKATMYDDGQHGDGAANDGVWGVSIAAQQPGALVDYYVEAKTSTGAASYLPHTAELEIHCPHVRIDWPVVPSPIVINEFVAQNVTGAVDENGQHEDWVELYNTSSQTVDISGKWLSDSLAVLKYRFPAGTTIAPYSVLRVWCDEDGTQGPLHANFKLAATGEDVALYDASGLAIHDWITYGPQQADVSTGRVTDGALPWVTFPAPTYLATNLPAACGQRTYGALQPVQHGMALTLAGTLQIGTAATFSVAGGPASGLGLVVQSLIPAHFDLATYGYPGETLLLSPSLLVVPAVLLLDGTGASSWPYPIPNDPGVVGI